MRHMTNMVRVPSDGNTQYHRATSTTCSASGLKGSHTPAETTWKQPMSKVNKLGAGAESLGDTAPSHLPPWPAQENYSLKGTLPSSQASELIPALSRALPPLPPGTRRHTRPPAWLGAQGSGGQAWPEVGASRLRQRWWALLLQAAA